MSIRLTTSCLIAAGSFMLTGPAATHAATSVVRNGVTWANTYEGDVADWTTSTPAWGAWAAQFGGATHSSDGDIYTYTTPTAGAQIGWSNSTGFSGSARTVEARVRVPSHLAGDGAGSILLGVNDDAYDLRLYSDGLAYNFPGLSTVASLDMTQFHVLRIVIDESAAFAYSLYIDGNPTPTFQTNSIWFTSSGFDTLIFGDGTTGGVAGNVELDYISWTPGAFAPEVVPEPAALGLLTLGGLLSLYRRR